MTQKKPKIGITMGDPSGIGPEILTLALASPELKGKIETVVFGDLKVLKRASDLTGAAVPGTIVPGTDLNGEPKALSPQKCGEASIAYLDRAIQAAMKKEIDAIVTAPVNKSHWEAANCPFHGHTEYLANMTGTKKVAMAFCKFAPSPSPLPQGERVRERVTTESIYTGLINSKSLFISLVTTHEPISEVSRLITIEKVIDTITLTNEALQRYFGIKKPRIAVAGLNPHAGEDGLIGKEEKAIIRPAILISSNEGIDVSGPFPADTIFRRAAAGEFDAVVAMYHDQGLIPLKTLNPEETVNLTLGLPFIRTSVGHGTADDIAWNGQADAKNMITAIETAAQIYSRLA